MNKESKEIITKVLRFWVSYFGAPDIFLTDNGREFDNEEFRDMAQNLNIVVKTTAAQSPWSNGLVERHNGVLGNMVKKTIEDTGCTIVGQFVLKILCKMLVGLVPISWYLGTTLVFHQF